MVIRYRGTPPSLAVAKGSAHTHVFMYLSSEVVMLDVGVLGTAVPRLAYLRPAVWLH